MSETTAKENFSGDAEIIGAAHSAASKKFGERKGSWSRWVVEAIVEKLEIENPELLKAVKALSAAGSQHTEIIAKVTALLESNPGSAPQVEKFVRDELRKTRRTAA